MAKGDIPIPNSIELFLQYKDNLFKKSIFSFENLSSHLSLREQSFLGA